MRYLIALISILLLATTSCARDKQHLFTELTKIAESGSPEAQYHLGMLYNNGIGTDKDIAQAFYWFEKSASAGDPLGHYKVGCYYSGQGEGVIPQDKIKALQHKIFAAEKGYVRAQNDVAAIYYLSQDMSKAIMWWEKAAAQGYGDAVIALYSMYSEGRGIPKDPKKAYGYLKIIERNTGKENKPKVEEQIEVLKKELSPTEQEEAENFAKNWAPQKTELTIKAFAGIEESWRIVESANENITSH